MEANAILLPVIVQVLLTYAIGFWTAHLRFRAAANKEVRVKDIALAQDAWPERVQKAGNCFRNQFEGPILLYAIVPLALITGTVTTFMVVMAWIYVASRFAHAYIHMGTNNVLQRFRAYGLGMMALLAMWVAFAIQIMGQN